MRSGGDPRLARHDPDLRLPEWLLHFFPVFLALFVLTMTVAGDSVFFGFEEDEPITWMSLTLMLGVLMTLLAVVRDGGLEPHKRWAAGVLAAVTGFALLDESIGFHEDVGRWVKNEMEIFTRDVRHYTDDFIVILFAIAGGLLFYLFARRLEDRRAYLPYGACAVALALAHGVLDVLGHGRRLWRALDPEITSRQVALLTDVLSVYEEACKLWAEWFVLLFVLRLFHRQKGPLGWSLLVMLGLFLAPIGLWAIEDPAAGVPYVVMERTLRMLRNPHLLLTLAAVFAFWSILVWVRLRERADRRALAGLFFLAPFYAALPGLARAIADPATRLGAAGSLILALLLWGRGGRASGTPALAGAAIALGLGLLGFSAGDLTAQPLLLLTLGGVLFPLALALLARRQAALRSWPAIALAGLAAALVQNPLWLLGAFGLAILSLVEARAEPLPVRTWSWVLALQGLAIAGVFYLSASGILPEYDFDPPETVIFETGVQEIDPDYYRRDR